MEPIIVVITCIGCFFFTYVFWTIYSYSIKKCFEYENTDEYTGEYIA